MWVHLHFQGSALGWSPNPLLVLQFKYHSQATVSSGQVAQRQDVTALCLFLRVSHCQLDVPWLAEIPSIFLLHVQHLILLTACI